MNEKKCKYCAMMIPKEAKICPHCRKTLGWTWPVKIVVGLFILGIIGSILGRGNETSVPTPAKTQTVKESRAVPVPQEDGLTLGKWAWERGEYGNNYIAGVVNNNSSKKYTYAQISFNLYDRSGAQIGSAWTNINNIDPGGTWKFKAIVIEKEAYNAKFSGITAF